MDFETGKRMLTLSPETEALVHAKAIATRKTPDQVIREALDGAAVHPTKTARGSSKRKASLADILAIADRSASRPLLDPRTADEIVGYDERGIPA
jgi:antitoxin VapB